MRSIASLPKPFIAERMVVRALPIGEFVEDLLELFKSAFGLYRYWIKTKLKLDFLQLFKEVTTLSERTNRAKKG